jgi:hypothetical protein
MFDLRLPATSVCLVRAAVSQSDTAVAAAISRCELCGADLTGFSAGQKAVHYNRCFDSAPRARSPSPPGQAKLATARSDGIGAQAVAGILASCNTCGKSFVQL